MNLIQTGSFIIPKLTKPHLSTTVNHPRLRYHITRIFFFKYSEERNALEKQIDEHFISQNLIKSEMTMDDTLRTDIVQTFKCKLKDNSAIHKFLYSAKKDSPLFATKKTDELNDKLKLISRASHDAKLWNQLYLECKQNKEWETRISLWMLIQHQTVSLITNKYNFPTNLRKELEHCIGYSDKNKPQKINKNSKRLYMNKMEIGTENMDCIVAGIKLKKAGYNPVILNLANQESPAAAKGKGSEGGTQEENLFKRSTYYLSLWPNRNKNKQHTPLYGYDDIWKKEEKETKENTDENSDKKGKKNRKKNKKKKGKGNKEVYMYPMHDK